MAMNDINKAKNRLKMIKQQLSQPSPPSTPVTSPSITPPTSPTPPIPCKAEYSDSNDSDTFKNDHLLIHYNFGVIISYNNRSKSNKQVLMAYSDDIKTYDDDDDDDYKYDYKSKCLHHKKYKEANNLNKIAKVSQSYYPTPGVTNNIIHKQEEEEMYVEQQEGTPEKGLTIKEGIES